MLTFHNGEAFLPYRNKDKNTYLSQFEQIKLIRMNAVHHQEPIEMATAINNFMKTSFSTHSTSEL